MRKIFAKGKIFYVKMGLEKVKDEIVEKAKEQASLAVSQAKSKAGHTLREAEKKIEEYRNASLEDAKNVMVDIKRQEIARAELEAKKMFLQSKKEIIDEVMENAKKELLKSKEREMSDLISSLLNKAKNDIEIEYVYCNKMDSKFIKGCNVKEAEISGGLIAENKEQTIRVDYSFDTLFQSMRENKLQEIAQELFG